MNSLSYEANRCLKCKKPMCAAHCPINTPIPEVMKLFINDKIEKAGELLIKNNPLSAITSIVCPHENNCFGHCVLGKKGEPIEFYRIEQYISTFYLEALKLPKIEKNGKKVAVIGSGPAGITMAMKLAFHGYSVTIFEADEDIGGVLRYGIPAFRLSKDLLVRYKEILHQAGVKIRLNVTVGADIDVHDLFADGYKAIFFGIGTRKPNHFGLLGETLGHVNYAINYLKSPSTYLMGINAVVIGCGNVAMDAARTIRRQSLSKVTVLNRMSKEDISASPLEVEMAELDGVNIIHNCQAVRITDTEVCCIGVSKVEKEDGTYTYEEDFSDSFSIPADSVIIAIGQGPGAELKYGSFDQTNRGLIQVNERYETNIENVYAAGDIVTAPSTVVQAVASTLNCAKYMLEKLDQM